MPTTKDFKLEELSKYFHLPEKAVAKELGICLTSLKKICRSYGITRWPFRKLKSIQVSRSIGLQCLLQCVLCVLMWCVPVSTCGFYYSER